MKEAAEFAESTQILMNVSEFTDVSQATDTLISAVQAFGYTAETSMDVVDLLNTIGNNYAISTADLAKSLTKSSASLVAAGGNLAEAAALTATANAIIQDADSVGTALKTTSLRLRGTSVKVLEEEGLDSDGAVESTSKLRGQVLATSGVDILTDTGAYKSTYQILLEIAEVWDQITDDKARAGLLELLAGKRNSSVIAALLQNPEDLKAAYEDAMDAEGSALKENEHYLDSIQGKIDQFNNAMQAMWSNTLDSDMVKGFVSLGTEIVKVIDKIGLLNTALIALATISMIKNKMGPIAFLGGISDIIRDVVGKVGSFIGSLTGVTAATSAYTSETLAASVANGTLSASEAAGIASKNGLTLATTNLTAAEAAEMLMKAGVTKADALAMVAKLGLTSSTQALSLADIEAAVSSGALTAAQGAQISSALGLTAANTGLAASFMALWTAMWPILAVMAGVAVIWGVVKAFDAVIVTTEELGEELSDLKSELSDIESDIDSLNSELETTQDRMAELTAMPSLSFVEQEELNNLKQTTAELERQLKLKEMLKDSKEDAIVAASEKYIDKAWNSTSVDKSYYVDADGVIHEDTGWNGFWNLGTNTKDALDEAMQKYDVLKRANDARSDLKANWDNYVSDGVSEDEFSKMYFAATQQEFAESGFDQMSSEAMADSAENLKRVIFDSGDLEEEMTKIAGGINMVFADENFDDLEYGMSEEINTFLDEMYAYQLKWKQAQGQYVKSDAISSMFDATSTKEMQEFGKALQNIADSDLTDEEKNAKILEQLDGIDGTIGDGINQIDGATDAYNRLHLAMNTVGVTAQDIADYFVLETGVFNSNTAEGIINQYNVAKTALDDLKSGAINLDDLVKYDPEKNEATGRVDKIAELLNGVGPEIREQFTSIVEAVKEGTMDYDEAIKKLELHSMQSVINLAKIELESANKLAFPELEVSGWIDSVDELRGAFESLASAMDLIVAAQEQMDSSGRISMKTALDLMEATDDWNQILEVNNGVITMNANAEQILIQSKLDLIKTNIEMALQQAETDIALMEGAINSTKAGNAFTQGFTKALANAQGILVGLKAGWDAFWAGEDVASAFNNARQTTIDNLTPDESSLGELYAQRDKLQQQLEMLNGVDTTQEFKDNYDFDKTPGDKYDDDPDAADEAFRREMDYWENRIAANQAKYEQLQNEIDLLEKKGQKADASYYQEQAKVEQERLWLLEQQKQATSKFLTGYRNDQGEWIEGFKEGTEEWWEWANVINDIEGEIDDVTASLVDLQDAVKDINDYRFDEYNTRLDNLTSKISTIRDLIAPNGEEDWFDKQGNWTDKGSAVVGTYLQELEHYEQGYYKTIDEMKKYGGPYVGNENYYAKLGIHSEQELYDKQEELIGQQYDYMSSMSDTKQSIVDMYESGIDAVEEYTESLIDGYNDYIDSVKEALDAERDLYDFKKNIQKQSKDIATIERRIASLSGSTNAADVAERRKLEAQLYESRESLNDTYYDHAKESQQNALDAEATAYEESMNRMIEGIRTSFEQATTDIDLFLSGVSAMTSLNAGAILQEYRDTGVYLDPALTYPWEKAKAAVGNYSGDALGLMNQWTQGGFFSTFPDDVGNTLSSPWTVGTSAANAFEISVDNVMDNVTTKIESNVKKSVESFEDLKSVIQDTAIYADSITVGEKYIDNNNSNNNNNTKQQTKTESAVKLRGLMKTSQEMILGSKSFVDANTETINGTKYYRDSKTGYYYKISDLNSNRKYDGGRTTGWAIPKGTWFYTKNAKGTTGTKRDGWNLTDEPLFGDELVLIPTPQGNLSYMRKGTGVVPADLTANLMEWGQFTPDAMNLGGGVNVNMINNAVNKPEFNFAFDALVKAENITEETLPAVKKLVTQELNRFTKELNYALKGKGAR